MSARDDVPSTKPILDKFGIKPDHRVCVLAVTDGAFLKKLGERVGPIARTARGTYDVIVWQIDDPRTLAKIAAMKRHMEPAGMLWFITPKGKGSAVPERVLREAYLGAGLVDIKISAFSDTHTATKCVIPVKDRS